MNRQNILFADDDDAFRDRLHRALSKRGYHVTSTNSGAAALTALVGSMFDVALVDLKMPGQPEGLALVRALHAACPAMRIIVLTGYGSIPSAIEALRSGAENYLTKPADADQIESALRGEKATRFRSHMVPSLDLVEWEHIQRVLSETRGNISEAARLLGLDRRSLQRKLAKFAPLR